MVRLTQVNIVNYRVVHLTATVSPDARYEYKVLLCQHNASHDERSEGRFRLAGPLILGATDLTEAYVNTSQYNGGSELFSNTVSDVEGIACEIRNTQYPYLNHWLVPAIVDATKLAGGVMEFSWHDKKRDRYFKTTFCARVSADLRYFEYRTMTASLKGREPVQPGLPQNWTRAKIPSNYIKGDENRHLYDDMFTIRDTTYLTHVKGPRGSLKFDIDQKVLTECVTSAHVVDTNTLEYASDLGELLALVAPLRASKPKTLKEAAKVISSLYLSEKYGWENMFRDTRSLAENAVDYVYDWGYSTTRAGDSVDYEDAIGQKWSYDSFCIINYSDLYEEIVASTNAIDILVRQTNDINFANASSLWDVVPFSFVVDWFVNLGSALEMVDARNYATRLPVYRCITTYRFYRTGDVRGLGWLSCPSWFTGIGKIQYYNRTISREVPEIKPSIKHPNQGLLSHWAEGSALIISKL